MFGKKKKEKTEDIPQVDVNKADLKQDSKAQEEKPKELTEEEKALLELLRYYSTYYKGIYQPNALVSQPEAVYKAEVLNIQIGIFCELKKLNEQIREMNKEP